MVWFPKAKLSRAKNRPGSVNGGEYVLAWTDKATGETGWDPGIDQYDKLFVKAERLNKERPDRDHYPKPYDSVA